MVITVQLTTVATGDQLRTALQATDGRIDNKYRTSETAILKLLRSVCAVLFSLRRVRKIAKSDYRLCNMSVCLSVRPPARTEQLGSHWKKFRDI